MERKTQNHIYIKNHFLKMDKINQTVISYKRVIINDSVITRTDESGVNINSVFIAENTSTLDKFITKSRMIITNCENGLFKCVFMDCYYGANLRLDPVTVSI